MMAKLKIGRIDTGLHLAARLAGDGIAGWCNWPSSATRTRPAPRHRTQVDQRRHGGAAGHEF